MTLMLGMEEYGEEDALFHFIMLYFDSITKNSRTTNGQSRSYPSAVCAGSEKRECGTWRWSLTKRMEFDAWNSMEGFESKRP